MSFKAPAVSTPCKQLDRVRGSVAALTTDLLPATLSAGHAVASNIASNLVGKSPAFPHKQVVLPPLSPLSCFAYGVGHVLNDLVASCWFSYVLVFFRAVLNFSAPYAGLLLLIGQVADGMATPVVGYLSDISNAPTVTLDPLLPRDSPFQPKPHTRIGRKVWIGVGSLIVALSFPPLFHRDVFGFDQSDHFYKLLYFSFFIIILQFAWASVQVSHLALVPDLTREDSVKVYLNSLRSFFTILSNVTVFFLAWFILYGRSSGSDNDNNDQGTCSSVTNDCSSTSLNSNDESSFFLLSLIVCGVGLCFSMFFLCGVSEPPARVRAHGETCFHWYMWFGQFQFYQTALIYTCTRLLVNVSQTYMPLYLLTSLNAPKTSIASIPLTVFGAGLASTLACEKLTAKIGTRYLTVFGCFISLIACGLITFIQEYGYATYGVAVLLGFGTGIVGVSALSLICDLVGDKCESSAFVYGSMSFTDKISNGLAIMLCEYFSPHPSDPNFRTFYSNVMVYVPGTAAFIALVMLSFIIFQQGGGLKPRPCNNDYEPIPNLNNANDSDEDQDQDKDNSFFKKKLTKPGSIIKSNSYGDINSTI